MPKEPKINNLSEIADPEEFIFLKHDGKKVVIERVASKEAVKRIPPPHKKD